MVLKRLHHQEERRDMSQVLESDFWLPLIFWCLRSSLVWVRLWFDFPILFGYYAAFVFWHQRSAVRSIDDIGGFTCLVVSLVFYIKLGDGKEDHIRCRSWIMYMVVVEKAGSVSLWTNLLFKFFFPHNLFLWSFLELD